MTDSTMFINAPYEIWSSSITQEFLANKYIVFVGDSIQRCAYKDLVTLLQRNSLVPAEAFKKKTEDSHDNDTQISVSQEKTNTFGFFQVRSYYHEESNTRLAYFFVTRIWSPYCQYLFENDFKYHKPDVIIANSMLYIV